MLHYQSIVTKHLGPTNTRGGRVKATSSAGLSITVSWDHAETVVDNHVAAARALAEKHGWSGMWVMGGMEPGFVFVNLPDGQLFGAFTVEAAK